jgi:hypothetical protein
MKRNKIKGILIITLIIYLTPGVLMYETFRHQLIKESGAPYMYEHQEGYTALIRSILWPFYM